MAEYFKHKIPIEDVARLAGLGLNWKQIAGALSISEDTLKRRRDADPTIEDAFNHGRASTISAVANAVVQRAIEGCPQSQKLYLNSIGGWAKKIEVEHDATPIFRLILQHSGEQPAP